MPVAALPISSVNHGHLQELFDELLDPICNVSASSLSILISSSHSSPKLSVFFQIRVWYSQLRCHLGRIKSQAYHCSSLARVWTV